MESNVTATSCIKPMDIRFKYVNEYAEDGIVFMKSSEINSNILTKSTLENFMVYTQIR